MKMKRRALAFMLLGVGACAQTPAKPPGSVASIDVAYEDNPDAPKAKKKPDAPELAYWKDRKDLIQAPAPPQATALALPKVDRWTMKNGLEVVVVARKELPVVSFGIAIKAGGYDEDKATTLGVSDFVAAMLRRGTDAGAGHKKRSADDISRAIDFVGGVLDGQAGLESSSVSCSVLSKDTNLCVDLLADVLQRPSFPDKEMPEVREQMLAALASRYDSPADLAQAHFDNLLFGEKNPAGWVLAPEDVQKITRDALVTFWTTYYRPNNAVLAIAGDVDPARLRVALEKAFGKWQKADVPARPPFKMAALKATRVLIVDKPDLTQSTILLGHRGLKHADPMWFPATLMNYVLGGSDFSSRLMTEVRSKRGLTYGISSSYGATLYDGAFEVSASTKNESVWEALVATVNQIRKMKNEGPTAAELAKGKGYYAGSYPFELETAAGVAGAIVGAELHGLGLDYVTQFAVRMAAVDEAQAKEAAGTLLDPDNVVVVVVGKGAVVEPQLAPTGLRVERIDFKAPISRAARAKLLKQPASP
ncbi:MAG TPA: pitrilysin family protein [Polyangia bacterium]|nr:pitrilysin family protein [Polyangia bacterium]